MKMLLKNAALLLEGQLIKKDVLIENDIIVSIEPSIPDISGDLVFFLDGAALLPGFVDIHVHLREPGFSYKETIASGTLAGAKGGYVALCAMPNLDPVPDSEENILKEIDIIKRDALIPVFACAAITKVQKGTELSDIGALSKYAVGFSDDGRGVQSGQLMASAMEEIKKAGSIICAHCEDESELLSGYIHDGRYAKENGHAGISSKSEWVQLERDIALLKETGARYHVCHVSTKESVELIRRAKKDGLKITAETAPHYLILSDDDLRDEGRFKMNPPIRSSDDRAALIEGIKDGTIDAVATDHAPHSDEEKSKGLSGSLNGVVGLECAFAALYTGLVKTGTITLEKLIDLMSHGPRRVMAFESSAVAVGQRADIAVVDLNKEYVIDGASFVSKGKSTPFEGMRVYGENIMTICGGAVVWKKEK